MPEGPGVLRLARCRPSARSPPQAPEDPGFGAEGHVRRASRAVRPDRGSAVRSAIIPFQGPNLTFGATPRVSAPGRRVASHALSRRTRRVGRRRAPARPSRPLRPPTQDRVAVAEAGARFVARTPDERLPRGPILAA